jgi:chromosome segregation ATPase
MQRLMFSVAALFAALGAAQAQAAGGTIVCWTDKSGKVVGCGDRVPPEYQDNATKELNQRGITVKTTPPALTLEQKKAQQAELERKQAETQKMEEQRRRDKALLASYTTEQEIDLKRERDVQILDSYIESLQSSLKAANYRLADWRNRMDQYKKRNAPVPAMIQEEIKRIEGEKVKIQNEIAQKRKEIAAAHQMYDELKKRFVELKGGG